MSTSEMEPIEAARATYIARVRRLLDEVSDWVRPRGFESKPIEIELNERALGKYKAPALVLLSGGQEIATVVPIGAAIIAAQGRVDLLGQFDTSNFLYLLRGGPSIQVTESGPRSGAVQMTRALFAGVNEEGWYWIPDRSQSRAVRLTAEVFLQLVAGASGRE